jgi:hypothetical protein
MIRAKKGRAKAGNRNRTFDMVFPPKNGFGICKNFVKIEK